MSYSSVKDHIEIGEFDQALAVVKNSDDESINNKLFEAIALSWKGEAKKSVKLLNTIKNPNQDLNIKIAAESVRAFVNIWLGDIFSSLKIIEKLEKILSNNEINQDSIFYWSELNLITKGLIEFFYDYKTDLNQYLIETSYFKKNPESRFLMGLINVLYGTHCCDLGGLKADTELIPESIVPVKLKDFPVLDSFQLDRYACFFLIGGNFDQFKNHINKAKIIWDDTNFMFGQGKYHKNFGTYNLNTGNLDAAYEEYKLAFEIFDRMGFIVELGNLHRLIGETYFQKGKLNQALDQYKKSLEIRFKLDQKWGIAEVYSHIGKIFHLRGEIGSAHENYQRGYELRKELNFQSGISISLDALGTLFMDKGNYKLALDYFTKSLKIKEEIGNDFTKVPTLYHLILLNIETGKISEADSLLEKLGNIKETMNNPIVTNYYKLASAIVLSIGSRPINKSKAQILLNEIVKNNKTDNSILVSALLKLAELLIWELKSSGEEEIIHEIDVVFSKMLDIADQQNAFGLRAKIFVLQSRVALINLDLNLAKDLLTSAQSIADENGLRNLAIRISNEYDDLIANLSSWNEIIEKNISFEERIKISQLEIILSRFNSTFNEDIGEIPNEKPVLFLILSNDGSTIFSQKFVQDIQLDDKVVGTLLSAIFAFNRETFGKFEEIERIVQNKYTILLKPYQKLRFCYIIEGRSYSAMQKIEILIEAIQANVQLWDKLLHNSFEINSAETHKISKIVNELISTNEVDEEENFENEILEPSIDHFYDQVYGTNPQELLSHKFLLNPIRLAITKILSKEVRFPAAELRKILGASWGNFNDSLKILEKKGFIEMQREFIDDKPRNILYITPVGSKEYSNLKDTLQLLIYN